MSEKKSNNPEYKWIVKDNDTKKSILPLIGGNWGKPIFSAEYQGFDLKGSYETNPFTLERRYFH